MSIGDESPARVALKLILTEPVPIDAKILFFPAQTGHSLVVAAEGGWMALMTERAWQMVVELAPEGGTFADLVGRAVIFEMKPSAALPGFLATLDDLGPPLP